MCTLTQRHAAAVIFLVLLLVMPVDAGRSAISFPSAEEVTVCEVIDGDTFSIYPPGWLEGVDPGEYGPDEPYRHTVRLIGINTPERHRPGYEEATAALEELLPQGTQVCLTADLDERDGSNPWRWLAYAETLSCDDVGAELLDEGWAVAWRYLPNCERVEEYRQLMAGAFTAGRGSSRWTRPPSTWPRTSRTATTGWAVVTRRGSTPGTWWPFSTPRCWSRRVSCAAPSVSRTTRSGTDWGRPNRCSWYREDRSRRRAVFVNRILFRLAPREHPGGATGTQQVPVVVKGLAFARSKRKPPLDQAPEAMDKPPACVDSRRSMRGRYGDDKAGPAAGIAPERGNQQEHRRLNNPPGCFRKPRGLSGGGRADRLGPDGREIS